MNAVLRTAFDLLDGLDHAHTAAEIDRQYFDRLNMQAVAKLARAGEL